MAVSIVELSASKLSPRLRPRLAIISLKVSGTWQQTRGYSALHGRFWVPKQSHFRATLFDKSPLANWLVVWHQDTALPIRERHDALGWGPWSVKDGITYAHAPASALCQVLALRVHLDESNADNGPLRVLPGTHTKGILSDNDMEELAGAIPPIDCVVPQGGVLAMRPLIVHASSKSHSQVPRRVVHIEYSACKTFNAGLDLAIT